MKNLNPKFMYSLLLFLSFNAFSLELSILRDSADGLAVQTFYFESNKVLTQKKSNYFDRKSDYRLGEMSAAGSSKISAIKTGLERIKKKLSDSRAFLKTKSVPIPVQNSQRHTSYFLLDGMVIEKGTIAFEDAEKELVKLLSLNWKLQDGVSISKDMTKVSEFKNGRNISSIALDSYFSCRSIGSAKICRSHKKEVLYVD